MDPEALYVQLGHLVAEMPVLAFGPITADINRWLGRAAQLVEEAGDLSDTVGIKTASDFLVSNRAHSAQQIQAIVYRALARAEANAPTAARGGFVGPGAALDALQVVARVLAQASRDALIVDPYMSAVVLTDFAPTVPAGVTIRLLADSASTKPEALRPAIARFIQQFGTSRPLQTRLSAARVLHDRLVFADGSMGWTLSQSLKDFAGRSPALAQRLDADLASMKIAVYEQIWVTATPIA